MPQQPLAVSEAQKHSNWATHPLVDASISNFGAFQDTIAVRSIATPRENLKMCDLEEDLRDVAARSVVDQFDRCPVLSGETIIGWIDLRPFLQAAAATGKIRDCDAAT